MKPYYQDEQITLHHGDALEVASRMPASSADCIVTSPPYYGLRDYGTDGQYGLEASPAAYVETMCRLFHELRRVLADDGTLWLNIGDSYASSPPGNSEKSVQSSTLAGRCSTATRAGRESVRTAAVDRTKFLPPKNLLGVPWRVAFALQDDGWILRNAIVWHKPNAMPESVRDRFSTTYEIVFMFSKSQRYWFDIDPIREPYSPAGLERRKYNMQVGGSTYASQLKPGAALRDGGVIDPNPLGRNPGDVWTLPTQPFSAAHFAVFPPQLPQRSIAAGCKPGGTVLDPFSGSGTTGLAAQRLGRKYIGIDINKDYLELSLATRLKQQALDFGDTA